MPEQEKEVLTKNDLNRVFIRVQDEERHWDNISCDKATDKQFSTWAQTRRIILGPDYAWSPEERADFCNQLYQSGELVVLKKGVNLE